MKRKFLLAVMIVLTVALSGGKLAAQVGRSISLKEAIDLSITNSKQLKTSAARIEEATAALKEAVERKLPSATVSGSHLRLNNPNVDVKLKSNSSNSGGTGGGTGTTEQSSSNPSYVTYGMVSASLPIYAGSKIKYGIESSKYLEEAAKLDADNDREAVVLNTINAYDNLFKARAAVDLVKESLEGARQRVKDFSNLEKNGLLARNDLLKAQLQESNVELSLLDAENNWRLANINMDLMLGLSDTTTLDAQEGDLQLSSAQLRPVEDYVQLGLQSRKDVAALGYRKKAAATGVKAAKGDSYPAVALSGGYVAADIPHVFTVTNAINIGVGVQYNLASLWKNSSLEQAKAREKEVTAGEEMLNDAVRLQVNQAYQNYLLSQKKIEVYDKAVAQAAENFKIVQNKFSNQLATTTDLLDADVARLQARLNSAFAKADAAVAYNKLLQTAGLLTTK